MLFGSEAYEGRALAQHSPAPKPIPHQTKHAEVSASDCEAPSNQLSPFHFVPPTIL
jgi:hypothetical protein